MDMNIVVGFQIVENAGIRMEVEYIALGVRSFSRRKSAAEVAQRRGGGHQEPRDRHRAGAGGSDAVPENLEGRRNTESRKKSFDRGLALERHDPALGGRE